MVSRGHKKKRKKKEKRQKKETINVAAAKNEV